MNKISDETGFIEVLNIIQQSRNKALKTANSILIETCWTVGQYLSRKVAMDGWGKGIVKELSSWLSIRSPELKEFYIRSAIRSNWSKLELLSQIKRSGFQRTMHDDTKLLNSIS